MKINPSTLFIIFFLFAIILKAQEAENEIETDRPDMTESAKVVQLGIFQFEDGFLL